ncbi:chitinase-like protein Idgf1 [Musca autumnalis]|uniref:chitinase-like protein Idgf1 n=1 Tax=Musca autumnalis TaxID=221902 RepID=UPI003CEC0F70
MKLLLTILSFLAISHGAWGQKSQKRIVCYYNAQSSLRSGLAKFPTASLEYALQFCTHLMYGYAGLTRESFEIASLNVDLDMFHFRQITQMKRVFPDLKIFLSLGGDYDIDEVDPQKYVHFLEGGKPLYDNFIHSSVTMLKNNGFDGLDLAFQFPRNKPRKVHGTLGTYWKKFKKLFTGNFIVDPEAETHKAQFTEFAQSLKSAYSHENLSLALTVLPNVNSSWYFDIPTIHNQFEYINLFAFDFLTPERNPEEADFTAPIFLKDEQNRLPHYNIDFQVKYWLDNGCPANKLNLGVATYGRTWKMTTDSQLSGMPVVPETFGPADAGVMSNKAGLLSWPEICGLLNKASTANGFRGPNAALQKVVDIERKYGNYAFRPADENNEHGIWISFDDPDFAGHKADYARQKGLGGIALYDLSYDDFRGLCTGAKFPILRSVQNVID